MILSWIPAAGSLPAVRDTSPESPAPGLGLVQPLLLQAVEVWTSKWEHMLSLSASGVNGEGGERDLRECLAHFARWKDQNKKVN